MNSRCICGHLVGSHVPSPYGTSCREQGCFCQDYRDVARVPDLAKESLVKIIRDWKAHITELEVEWQTAVKNYVNQKSRADVLEADCERWKALATEAKALVYLCAKDGIHFQSTRESAKGWLARYDAEIKAKP